MSNAALTASFTLKLEDKLSGGLTKLLRLLERFNTLGAKLGMPALETAGRRLDAVTHATERVDRAIGHASLAVSWSPRTERAAVVCQRPPRSPIPCSGESLRDCAAQGVRRE